MNIPPFVEYKTAYASTLPPITAAVMEYWLALNGVFIRAQRSGLEACIPIAQTRVRGLAAIEPYFHLRYPRVPVHIVQQMLQLSWKAHANEILYHLCFQQSGWQLEVPRQIATPNSVQPVGNSINSSYEKALIEVHSHSFNNSQFSSIDDGEETGFRLFAVLGHLFTRPEINTRIGIYSHFYPIPSDWVFDLPQGLQATITSKSQLKKHSTPADAH